MIKDKPYRNFSLRQHLGHIGQGLPSVCHFELTFRCWFQCRHCYSSCFNSPDFLKKELSLKDVRYILDGLSQMGVLWLCLSGGDPLYRDDFLDIYAYAKSKGFITTVFTSLYSMNKKILNYFKRFPPFLIESTINGANPQTFEYISQLSGSFNKFISNLKSVLNANLPIKLKTQITKDNVDEYHKLKELIKGLGLNFNPSFILYPQLNGDTSVCKLRVAEARIVEIFFARQRQNDSSGPLWQAFFTCAITSGDSMVVDPYGNVVPCVCLRQPKINALERGVKLAYAEVLAWIRQQQFKRHSLCQDCSLRQYCFNCPGRAFLETGRPEEKVEYYCSLAQQLQLHLKKDRVLSKKNLGFVCV